MIKWEKQRGRAVLFFSPSFSVSKNLWVRNGKEVKTDGFISPPPRSVVSNLLHFLKGENHLTPI